MLATQFSLYIKRLVLIGTLSSIFVLIFNEAVYLIQKEQYDRPPKTIEIIIPAGAANQVEAGQEAISLPPEMVFVIGDTLQVINQDAVSHQLGPLWIPPGSSASLIMQKSEKIAYSCSFQTSQYLGLDVRQPTTLSTRLTALFLAAPTTTALLYLYSLLLFPIRRSQASPAEFITN